MQDIFRPDEMVWIAVSIIEEALALKLQWHDSLIRSCFLRSLDVDVNQVRLLYFLVQKGFILKDDSDITFFKLLSYNIKIVKCCNYIILTNELQIIYQILDNFLSFFFSDCYSKLRSSCICTTS